MNTLEIISRANQLNFDIMLRTNVSQCAVAYVYPRNNFKAFFHSFTELKAFVGRQRVVKYPSLHFADTWQIIFK